MTILKCSDLTMAYGQKKALDEVSINIESGRIVGLLGPNGSGKTTLLKICNGLLVPKGGTIEIDGKAPGRETKMAISYLPERSYLNDWMTVGQMCDFFESFYSDFNTEKADAMLKSLDVDPGARIKSLSKGTKEKVQLILVMARDAKLYLLDEPIGGVDPAAREYILDTIIKNYNPDAAVVISTHLISDLEPILDDVIMLKDGVVTHAAPADTLREENGMSIDKLFREVFRC